MIIVDTNVLVYLFVQSTQTHSAMTVRMKDPNWHAPVLWRSEFRNAMAGYLRSGETTLEHALSTIQRAMYVMDGKEHEVNSADVMRLVSESNCSAYDCEFVALAQELGVPMVTSDRRILNGFPGVEAAPSEFVT